MDHVDAETMGELTPSGEAHGDVPPLETNVVAVNVPRDADGIVDLGGLKQAKEEAVDEAKYQEFFEEFMKKVTPVLTRLENAIAKGRGTAFNHKDSVILFKWVQFQGQQFEQAMNVMDGTEGETDGGIPVVPAEGVDDATQ